MAGGGRRIDWVATHNKIVSFLAKEVSKLRVEDRAEHLITTPRQIAEHTGLSVKTVKTHVLEIEKDTNKMVTMIKIDKVEVIIRLGKR